MKLIAGRLFNALLATTMVAIGTIAPSISLAQTSKNNKWANVLTDNRNRSWFVDTGTIRRDGPYRYFWSYITSNTPYEERGKQVYGTAYYLSANCQEKQFRLRFIRLIGQNSKVLGEYNFGEGRSLGKLTSDTGEAASLNFVCAWKK